MKSFFSLLLHSGLIFCSFNCLEAQWLRQYPMAKLEDVLDIDVSADGYGFAVGTNDLILRMLGGSNQWDLLPGYGEGWRFQAVDYMDGSGGNVAAAGGDGLIVTQDKGAHWNLISGAPAGINKIKVFSPTHIIVASSDNMYTWENNTWTNLHVPAPVALKGAFILNDQVMWAYTLATNPAIYYTTNGGMNWSVNHDIPKVDLVRFFDSQNGVATNARDVYHSTNGGANWTLIAASGLKNSANDLTFGTSMNVLIAVTPSAKPNISMDGGMTWNEITTSLINLHSYSVSAVSDTDFWVGNDLSGVMHSTDGGNTWEETSGPVRNLIQDVHFLNRSIGFATGQKGLILRTLDGGSHWEVMSFGSRSHLCIDGLTPDDLWIGTNQRILHSVDTGRTWTEAVVFPGGNINDILAISSERIVAVSTTGYIYLSKDGGMTWDSVYNSGLQMRSVARIDDQHYMATGFNGVILRSDDQGQTWHSVAIPEPALQYEKSFFLNGEGWLVTSSFKKAMWHTTNGGDSWDTLSLPIDRFWDGVYFITKDTGVVVSRSAAEGRAYLTFDGGHHWQSGYVTNYPFYGATGLPNPNGTMWIYGFGSDIEVLSYCNALPSISNFMGDLFPCEKDTVQYSVSSLNIDQFTWHFPPGWQILGNPNNDSLWVVPGTHSGNITVKGSNTCGETGQLSFSSEPYPLPMNPNLTGDLTPCQGDTGIFTFVNDILPVTYSISSSTSSDWQLINIGDNFIEYFIGADPWSFTLTATNQCGSASSTTPLITPAFIPQVGITSNGSALSLTSIAMMYQWYLNGQPIPGATNATFTPMISGSYTAMLTFDTGCHTTTLPVEFILSGTNIISPSFLKIYPVPASDILNISGVDGSFLYTIYDLTGRMTGKGNSSGNQIQITNLSDGLYVIKIETGQNAYTNKFMVTRK